MVPPTPPVNGLSIVSLVSGIVCCVPPLGLIFGLISLSQIRRRGERGKGMAIAGTILSALSTLLTLTLLVTGFLGSAWEGFKDEMDETSRSRSTLDLRAGDCFNLPGRGASEEKETEAVEAVDCDGEHQAEIAGDLKITGFDGFPGARRLETLAEKSCQEINDDYAMDHWEVPGNMDYYYYLPTRESWRLGDRKITCGFATAKGETTLGSVRRDASVLDPHQQAYLRAEGAVLQAHYLMPDAEFAQEVRAHQQWAGKMAGAFTAQARALRQYDWPPSVSGAAIRRAQEFERAGTHWEKAALAKNEESFWEHTQVGDNALREKTEIAIRDAIGLTTVPPIDETEDDSSL
ncbi:DUF4190 domain-containing protein [Streptomyces albipurpureus]|uniref:DUF4190 domain-containing protein n=1 Tax=Streptomyces albipurpureus TaxID=2897419 RepID=UPI0025537007|nr:DUF4190 domain-containing protein [Streptomyces sp. CWNU-1]